MNTNRYVLSGIVFWKSVFIRDNADFLINGKISQEAVYFLFSHIVRMAFVVKQDEFLNPVDIGLFSSVAVMFYPDGLSDSVN